MSTRHTPGPWTASITPMGQMRVHAENEYGVRDIVAELEPGIFILPEDMEANGRLIAAAPELLAALERIVRCADYEPPTTVADRVSEIARAALGKLEG